VPYHSPITQDGCLSCRDYAEVAVPRHSQSEANAGRAQARDHQAIAATAETNSQQVRARHIPRPSTASTLPILWLFSRNDKIIFRVTQVL